MVRRNVIIEIFLKVIQPVAHRKWASIDSFQVFVGCFMGIVLEFGVESHLTNWALKLFGMGNCYMFPILSPFQETLWTIVTPGKKLCKCRIMQKKKVKVS